MAHMWPQSAYVAPTLPAAAAATELRVVPAFPKGKAAPPALARDVALFQTVSVYAGARALKPYPVPNNIHDMIEGRKSAGFNPWKVQTNWRTRLHELLFLEEAQQVDRHQHHQRHRDRHTHATATATSAPHHRHQHPTPPPPPPPPPATPRTLLPPPHGGRRSSRERTTCTA